MIRRSVLPQFSLAVALTLPAVLGGLAGCKNDAETPAAKSAEEALGVDPNSSRSNRTVVDKHNVIVEDTKKVTDAKTGEVLSEKTVSTPVTIEQQKSEKTDVKVKVGDTTGPKK